MTWRSIVNRVWHWHFGRGLVSTPSDFGRMGALPSHPELLDWLARAVSRDRWLAQVVASSDRHELRPTGRACGTTLAFAAIDGENQWLWRQNRRRLDAESVHDAILAVAGQLDRTMRGPSVQQFALRPGVHVTPVVDYSQFDWNSPGSRRRSVYRFLFRTLPDPFFDAFDSADASQLTAVRNESTTPLQALELLNNPFVLRQCDAVRPATRARKSSRLVHRAGARSRSSWPTAAGRPPTKSNCYRLTPATTAWRTCAGSSSTAMNFCMSIEPWMTP